MASAPPLASSPVDASSEDPSSTALNPAASGAGKRVRTKETDNWLSVGLELLDLRTRGKDAEWQKYVATGEASAQTLNRFMRLASFVKEHFPEDLAAKKIKAGSAVMLEFIQLFELDPERARSIASGVFDKTKSVRTIRDERRALQVMTTPPASRAAHHTQRFADFTRQAIDAAKQHPDILGIGEKLELLEAKVRDTLSPKLYGVTKTGMSVAVDIKAPDPTATRTTSATAASLASRIAILLMKYDLVVILLPYKSREFAGETRRLIQGWAKLPEQTLGKICFAALDLDGLRTV